MNDCTYLTLYYSKDGYVVKCVYCNKIQLAFGNIIINQSLEEFHRYRCLVIDKVQENRFVAFPEQKNITLQTDSKSIMMVLSFNDLKLFYEMIQQANLMLEVNNIVLNQN